MRKTLNFWILNFVFLNAQINVPLNEFAIDYGDKQVTLSKTNAEIALSPNNQNEPLGARIHSISAYKAQFCADVQVSLANGTAFAIYASSGEPLNRKTDKWDELDVEFINTIGSNRIWANIFHDGKELLNEPYIPVSIGDSSVSDHRYCLAWDIQERKRAIWSVDGKVIKTFALNGWSKALKLYISYWGAPLNTDKGGLTKWFGINQQQNSLRGFVKNAEFQINFNAAELVNNADSFDKMNQKITTTVPITITAAPSPTTSLVIVGNSTYGTQPELTPILSKGYSFEIITFISLFSLSFLFF